MLTKNPPSITFQASINDTGRSSPKKKQSVSHHRGEKTIMPSISNLMPLILFNAEYTPSVLRKPNSCMSGRRNNLQKGTLNHQNPRMLQAPFVSRRKMGPTAWYKTIDRSIIGQSEISTHSLISNILPRNSKDTHCLLNLISDQDITMSVSAQEMNGRLHSVLRKDTGNPRLCILDNVTRPPPFNESSINFYNPLKINIQG